MRSVLRRSITEHAKALRCGEYSSKELTKAFLSQIDSVDVEIGAFLQIDPEVSLKAAEHADKILKNSDSPLCGIPISVKDNICTKEFYTTCASKILEGYISPYDAYVIEQLKHCGGVIIGKTNMDEFAMGSACDNSAFKTTVNPIDKTRSPGGSSGGAAASVAADECVCAIGSDTGGSVRQPAALCGLVGMKPTYGALSRRGLVSFASSLDQIGCLTRSVSDSAVLLSAISGCDGGDATCSGISADLISDIDMGVAGRRIGIIKELFYDDVRSDVRTAVNEAIAVLKDAGAEITEVSLPSLKYALSTYHIIADAEASSNLARYDGIRFGRRSTDEDLSLDSLYVKSRSEGFGREVKLRLMMGTYVLSAGSRGRYYEKAQRARQLIKEDFQKALALCDVLVSPMTYNTAPKLYSFSDDPCAMYESDFCGLGASLAGLPAISVPCGTGSDNLPVGIQIIGSHFSEAFLYRFGRALERGKIQ